MPTLQHPSDVSRPILTIDVEQDKSYASRVQLLQGAYASAASARHTLGETMPESDRRREADDFDREIADASRRVGVLAVGEVLYGSASGPGLVFLVTSLSTSVAELAKTVTTLATDINGDTGVKNTIRDLRRDFADLDKKFTEKSKEWEPIIKRTMWFLVGIGIATLLILGRAVEVGVSGHL